MAHIIVVLSGLADDPQEALDGRTPLAAARTPVLDELAAVAEVGLLHPLPEPGADDGRLGADLTTFALLGYDAATPCRGAVELLGAGAGMGLRDAGLRGDLIRVDGGLDPFPEPPDAGEAGRLWADLERVCSGRELNLRGTGPVRGLGLWNEGPVEVAATPPGGLEAERTLDEQYPQGEREAEVRRLIDDSREVLADHEVNRARRDAQKPTYDALWPWGFGRAPEPAMFLFRTGQVMTVVTGNLAVRGAARAAGIHALRRLPPEQRTPAARAARILGALDEAPVVYAHVSDLDRVAHQGDPEQKARRIEELDAGLLKPIRDRVQRDGLELTLVSDFACRCATRRHASRPVPYLAWRPGRRGSGVTAFDEAQAAGTGRQRYGVEELRGWLWGR